MQKNLVSFESRINTYVPISDQDRAEHMQYSMSRVQQRIQEGFDRGSDRVAVVCYGPSLLETWQKIRDFRYIISCSGSHQFLLDHGIVPTWHVEVDARAHKVDLMGAPHKDVQYLISSACHPRLIDHLEGQQISLWHTYNNEDLSTLPAIYPRGEWVFNGGSNVGLRAMVLARFLGFRFIDTFGMDCSYPPDHQGEHAGKHPRPAAQKHRLITVYDNTEYHTTPTLMHYAREFFKECSLMPEVKFTIHGMGMLQHMAHRGYTTPDGQAVRNACVLALAAPQVITREYRELNRQLHEQNPWYGISGHLRADAVIGIAQQLKTKDVLDYGCGKGTLAEKMPWPIKEYDPAIPGKDTDPSPADLVICTDVLEHIEPEMLDNVLMDIGRVTRRMAYLVIHSGPSMKTLPDGRNTHLIQQDRLWWYNKLEKWFEIDDCQERGFELHFVVRRRGDVEVNLVDVDRLNQTTTFTENSGIKFVNANGMMEWRARTMLTKEPITIEWLDSIQEGEILVDVGANVGIYTLYAAMKRFCQVYAFEPESQNYAALNYNINLNRAHNLVKAYCLALSNKMSLGILNLTQMIAGNSCHQFNRELDHTNKPARYSFQQGCLSMTLDWLVQNRLIEQPQHIKIDVDGIEYLVVQGMMHTLAQTKSMLIEINQNLPEHQELVQLLVSQGFSYDSDQVKRSERTHGAFKGVAEFLFRRCT